VLKHLDHRISGDLKNAEIVNDHGFFVGNQEKDLSRELHVLDEALGRCLDRR
jgi:hypothetical protein